MIRFIFEYPFQGFKHINGIVNEDNVILHSINSLFKGFNGILFNICAKFYYVPIELQRSLFDGGLWEGGITYSEFLMVGGMKKCTEKCATNLKMYWFPSEINCCVNLPVTQAEATYYFMHISSKRKEQTMKKWFALF